MNRRGGVDIVRFAVAGVCLIGIATFLVIFFRRSRNLAYIDSPIVTVRIIVAEEAKFVAADPERGYACSLSDLRAKDLNGAVLKGGRWNGYWFEIQGCKAVDGGAPIPTYYVTARPLHSDLPAFCSDKSEILKYDESGSIQECLRNGKDW